jgi:transposase
VTPDPRDVRIAELEALVAKLLARDAEREVDVARLEARVAELEEKLAASSRNSSKPPSSDPPTVERKGKIPTGRKRGGQPGHKKHEREMFPPEKVQKVVECKPSHCEKCRGRLHGHDDRPLRHQVAELPKIEPEVTEFRLHELGCACGHRTRAKLPAGTPTGAFGATVVAAITLLLGVYGLSRRDTAELLRDMFSLPISVGGVVGCQRLGAAALAPAHEEAQAEVPRAPIKYSDETGWKLGDVYACLWVVVTAKVTVFRIQAERSREAAMKVLGSVSGFLGSDRYSVYDCWPTHMHQFCWAHLSRLFVHFSERRDPAVKALGLALIEEKNRMFEWWYRVRDGTLTRATFKRYMLPVQRRVTALLEEGGRLSCAKTQRTCLRLLQSHHALWTFVYKEGLEPTNNVAERAIRRPVIIRKTSFGSQSEHGCRFLERVLTVHATLRQTGRSVHDFIAAACRAHMLGEPPPALLTP